MSAGGQKQADVIARRERILTLYGQGLDRRTIAARTGVAAATVDHHVTTARKAGDPRVMRKNLA